MHSTAILTPSPLGRGQGVGQFLHGTHNERQKSISVAVVKNILTYG